MCLISPDMHSTVRFFVLLNEVYGPAHCLNGPLMMMVNHDDDERVLSINQGIFRVA